MQTFIVLIRPILFSFFTSEPVKLLVIQLLTKYVKTTDNQIDDTLVEVVKGKLFTPQ